eukprot:1759943-Karenia_brevis.AAC.1
MRDQNQTGQNKRKEDEYHREAKKRRTDDDDDLFQDVIVGAYDDGFFKEGPDKSSSSGKDINR